MEEKEEQLFICDHAEKCDEPCMHKVKHHRSGGACCYDEGTCELARMKVTCIPYTEKGEPQAKKGCESCGKFTTGECVSADPCGDNFNAHVPINKPEPKIKRVAVIWFGDVPVDGLDHCYININPNKVEKVELIDPDRLRYCHVKKGDTFLSAKRKAIFESVGHDFSSESRLIIDPPTKPETVEQVLDDLFGMEDRHSLSKGIIDSFKSRIKAAQNNQPQPPEAC